MKENLDALLDEVARRASGGLLEKAVDRARERVVDELARRLEPALLAAALAAADHRDQEVGRQTSYSDTADHAGTVVTPGRGQPPADNGLYAYGITWDKDLDLSAVPGVGTSDGPRLVTRNGLGLIVSEIALSELAGLESAEVTEDGKLATMAQRHDAVVRSACDQVAVLPLRFGTVLPDEDAVAALLDDRHDQACAMLDRVSDKREWGAKIIPVAEPREAVAGDAPSGESPNGTEYLARKRNELTAKRQAAESRRQLADHAHRVLAGHATDTVRRSPNGAITDAAYLVANAHAEEFLANVRTLTDELASHGLRLHATGPWPPYTFATAGAGDA